MTQEYLEQRKINSLPPLPLKGRIDLTYRCNNDCKHCWLGVPVDSSEQKKELTFEEIRKIVDEARGMGCRKWVISGGEPMLRPDFAEIFNYLTCNCSSYSINTNGTLITPKLAKLMKRKGNKMVALYGATAKVHDHITRHPGSFEATMRGVSYLKEAGAGFVVHLTPMKDNRHQFKEMVRLAESLSRHYRIGVAWLHLSAYGDVARNAEIGCQRLSPKEVIELDRPDLSYEDCQDRKPGLNCHNTNNNEYLFSSCIANKRDFHIDPYGKMTFCCFIKDPALRYDLRKGGFKECWEKFIPSLAAKVKTNEEYKKSCGSCEHRKDCLWCPAYSYLEHRDFNKKIEYLCAVAKENGKFKNSWIKNQRRYYKIADITMQIDSDLPIGEKTFHPKFKLFEVNGPGEDTIYIRHHFSLPDLEGKDLGKEVYRRPPWAIYKKNDSWIYLEISPTPGDKGLHRIATFNTSHTYARIYNKREEIFLKGNLHSLALLPSDQILLARILADRKGCFLHACGVNFKDKGLVFAGHSEAGKSTMAAMLKGKARILCDDRIIIRKTLSAKRYALSARHDSAFQIYGTWSHGDVTDVSPGSAPLRAIMFLEKSQENRLIPIDNKKKITKKLLSCLIRPLVTVDWWEKTLLLIESIAEEVPCYTLEFDKSGEAAGLLDRL